MQYRTHFCPRPPEMKRTATPTTATATITRGFVFSRTPWRREFCFFCVLCSRYLVLCSCFVRFVFLSCVFNFCCRFFSAILTLSIFMYLVYLPWPPALCGKAKKRPHVAREILAHSIYARSAESGQGSDFEFGFGHGFGYFL